MEIIMPAAGLSTRFPNMRPKYTLSDFAGNMMFEKSLAPFIGKHHITIGVLKENEEKHSIATYIKQKYNDIISIVILENRTTGPADTVYQILKKINIDPTEEILIKDCDSFFEHEYQEGNYVCVSDIKSHEVLKRLGSKSFVTVNDQGIINSIIEKQVVSDKFCVGGYKFESANMFINAFDKLNNAHVNEIFVSHIIEECLNDKHIFKESIVWNYSDVGTSEDWFEHNDKSVIFCDIDGTIIEAQARDEYGVKDPTILKNNVSVLQKMVASGSKIIFTTARPASTQDQVYDMLKKIGFDNFQLITGLLNTKRILINDYNDANPYPRAIAINIKRTHDNLKDFL
jgi:hypothetical protein